jgi:hypothetical protein
MAMRAMKALLGFGPALGLLVAVTLGGSIVALPAFAGPPSRDITYEMTQTFTGKSFTKDEHVWIYTRVFAERFRMPSAWIREDLKGIEAAAFRIGEAGQTCGLGGREENCHRFQQCELDIYVDEKKHPLPWLTEKSGDWLPGTDSFRFLRDAERNAPGRLQPPVGITGHVSHELHPFGDWKTGRPAYYMQNAQTPKDNFLNQERILAYQRSIHGDLTMIRLNYGCLTRNKRPHTGFWLIERGSDWIGDMHKYPQKIYHHFQIPADFERQIDGVRSNRTKIEEKRYKQILNVK